MFVHGLGRDNSSRRRCDSAVEALTARNGQLINAIGTGDETLVVDSGLNMDEDIKSLVPIFIHKIVLSGH